MLANQASRWLAPAAPVFAGKAGSYTVCDLQHQQAPALLANQAPRWRVWERRV
ncbi:hypothetical protein [Pseudomonas muyukensis]|uniref:Uncharacterized protein n=1 Tax=Pseudomonas muyukensis TaxID=2842357 RepID=A0ABX8MFA6_9PSED|nr:hypothetical protein [Pseudomonas muyukensis]QXH37759.1 hypothetical protein KSS95_14895 [Pseudomonas muyukensis]